MPHPFRSYPETCARCAQAACRQAPREGAGPSAWRARGRAARASSSRAAPGRNPGRTAPLPRARRSRRRHAGRDRRRHGEVRVLLGAVAAHAVRRDAGVAQQPVDMPPRARAALPVDEAGMAFATSPSDFSRFGLPCATISPCSRAAKRTTTSRPGRRKRRRSPSSMWKPASSAAPREARDSRRSRGTHLADQTGGNREALAELGEQRVVARREAQRRHGRGLARLELEARAQRRHRLPQPLVALQELAPSRVGRAPRPRCSSASGAPASPPRRAAPTRSRTRRRPSAAP